MEIRDVYSSHINRVGHDEDADELHVWWDDGKHSVYENVPRQKFDSVTNSWSVGKMMHQEIKPYHPHRYASE